MRTILENNTVLEKHSAFLAFFITISTGYIIW